MPGTVEEIGRTFQVNEKGEITRKYFAHGYSTEPAAGAAVYAYLEATIGTPPNIGSTVVKNIRGDEKTVDGYKCTVTWGTFQAKPPPAKGDSQFNFEISVQPVKVIVPIGSITVHGANAPTLSLIGEQGDGRPPAGVEVYEPAHEESETHYLDATLITAGYKATVKSIVGKLNDATFKGHSAGEALLRGVSGSRRGVDDWEVTFRWSVKENLTDETIAGITGVDKGGWDYLWPIYEVQEDANGRHLTTNVTNIAVATVFRSADFSGLGI